MSAATVGSTRLPRGAEIAGAAVIVTSPDQLKQLMLEALAEYSKMQRAPAAPPKPERCSVPEAAAQLHCCVRHVYRLIKIGDLQRTRIGARVLVLQESIDALLAKETT